MNLGGEQKSLRVGDDVALAALDPLAGVDPAPTAALGCRDALAVDDAGARCRLTPNPPTRPRYQHCIDPLPRTVVAPAVEIPCTVE
jgi:hypothetical protein